LNTVRKDKKFFFFFLLARLLFLCPESAEDFSVSLMWLPHPTVKWIRLQVVKTWHLALATELRAQGASEMPQRDSAFQSQMNYRPTWPP